MTPPDWAAAALAVLLTGPGLWQSARNALDRRRAMAAARAYVAARPLAGPAAGTALSDAEARWLARYATWLATHPHARTVTGNGQGVADQLRLAMPGASDTDIARMLVTVLLALGDFRAYREPRAAWHDALGAAALDLTRLERSRL